MIYSNEEQKLIIQYWKDQYSTFCKKCQGTGYIDNHICSCSVDASVSATLELNGFGRKYLQINLSNEHLKEKLNNYLNNFPNNLKNGKGLYIFGKHNTEKTLAVTVLAKMILAIENPLNIKTFNIKFFLYDDLVRYSYDDHSFLELENIIKKTNILVLDNIGVETGLYTNARSSVSLLENIIRNRDMRGDLTWITSTLPKGKLSEVYNESIASIISRNNMIICSV